VIYFPSLLLLSEIKNIEQHQLHHVFALSRHVAYGQWWYKEKGSWKGFLKATQLKIAEVKRK
jgi:hypothetical protein